MSAAVDHITTTALGLHAATPGWVHLVGAGPGDPGLLTLRGAALLATADLVAYDRLADPRLLQLLPPHAEAVRVGKNPDRACGERTWTQGEINHLLVTAAREGRAVVRLKGGDPFVFGRGSEEALACRAADVSFEIVSGVTSAIAGPAAAGIPVTHRGLATGVAFVTGHEDPSKASTQVDWEALARFHGTLVFLMGVRRAPHITANLRSNGRPDDTPVAVVQWATTPRERVLRTTLADLPGDLERHGIGSPATIVVGDVVEVGALLSDALAPTGAAPAPTAAPPRRPAPPAGPAHHTAEPRTHRPAPVPVAGAASTDPRPRQAPR